MFQSESFRDYSAIFDRRGELYHTAMVEQPFARRAEFERIVQFANLKSGQIIADIPSGGGYLRSFVPDDVRMVAVETSSVFLRQYKGRAGDSQLLCDELTQIALPTQSLDCVLSLAGAHHLADKPSFFREVWRLLKPEGVFVLADVQTDSRVARFLNGWVHEHNSMGHQGVFLDDSTVGQLQSCGFEIEFVAPQAYDWEFDSEAAMVSYCRSLFGLDLADDAQILDGLQSVLGVENDGSRRLLSWELLFIRATKNKSGEQ